VLINRLPLPFPPAAGAGAETTTELPLPSLAGSVAIAPGRSVEPPGRRMAPGVGAPLLVFGGRAEITAVPITATETAVMGCARGWA
jgi:hypothetical protein